MDSLIIAGKLLERISVILSARIFAWVKNASEVSPIKVSLSLFSSLFLSQDWLIILRFNRISTRALTASARQTSLIQQHSRIGLDKFCFLSPVSPSVPSSLAVSGISFLGFTFGRPLADHALSHGGCHTCSRIPALPVWNFRLKPRANSRRPRCIFISFVAELTIFLCIFSRLHDRLPVGQVSQMGLPPIPRSNRFALPPKHPLQAAETSICATAALAVFNT